MSPETTYNLWGFNINTLYMLFAIVDKGFMYLPKVNNKGLLSLFMHF